MIFRIKNIVGLVFLALLFLAPHFVFARQMKIIDSSELNIKIENPEVFQEFYATKTSEPQVYEINSSKPFTLYAKLLLPDILEVRDDLIINIFRKTDLMEEHLGTLSSAGFEKWEKFYEPFSNDYYLKGPEIKRDLPAGTYFIEVNSIKSQACPPAPERDIRKYVLVIGQGRGFSLSEFFQTIKTLPAQKKFLNKSALAAYFNLTGLFISIPILAIFAVIIFIFKPFRKISIKKPAWLKQVKLFFSRWR